MDIGTSYTAAATARCGEAPQVLPLGSRAASIPSLIFLGADGSSLVGEAAERRGLLQPERLAREFKRRVGDDVPLVMGELSVLAEDLYASMVRHVVDLATEREGEAPATITLTHPAEWGGHKVASIRRAVAGVGLAEVRLITEPEAAALAYASQQRVPAGSTLAVYDLGGGTFDATVLRKEDTGSFSILGTPTGIERLGGADFDQAVFGHVVESLPGVFAALDHSAPETLQSLARLRRECAEAKEALSTDVDTTIAVFLPGVHEQVRLVRSEFESMIEHDLRGTVAVLAEALAAAEVEPQALSAILLIGGSSRIPLVAQLLSDEFELPLAVDADPKASIALGAAFATAALIEEPPAAAAPDAEPEGVVDARSFTPQHGPEALVSNRRLGMRLSLLVGAVALIGVATASAAGTASPFTALSSLTGGPGQEAAAAQPGDGAAATRQKHGGSAGEATLTDASAADGDGGSGGATAGGGPGTESEQDRGKNTDGSRASSRAGASDGAGNGSGDGEESDDRSKPGSSARPGPSRSSESSESSESSASPEHRPGDSAAEESGRPSPASSRTAQARPGTTAGPATSSPGAAEATPPPSSGPAPSTSPTRPATTSPAPTSPAPGTPDSTPDPATQVPATPDPTPDAPPAPETAAPGTDEAPEPAQPPSDDPASPGPAVQGGTDAPAEG